MKLLNAPNPLHTFPRNFPVDVKLPACYANKSATSWQQVVVLEFGKRHDRHNGLLPCQLATELLRGNWCNGFWF